MKFVTSISLKFFEFSIFVHYYVICVPADAIQKIEIFLGKFKFSEKLFFDKIFGLKIVITSKI